MKVENAEKLIAKLRARAAQSIKDDNVSVIVGYQKKYALWVHEMIVKHRGKPRPSGKGNYWDPQGQPKYLEQPAREYAEKIGDMVRDAVLGGRATLAQGLVVGGLYLQRLSMKLVPVEYGDLRGSAFTKLVRGSTETPAESNVTVV
jgi:hypothetical protein